MITPKALALINDGDAPFWVRQALKNALERSPMDALSDAQRLAEAVEEWAEAKLRDENERFSRMRGTVPEPQAESVSVPVAA